MHGVQGLWAKVGENDCGAKAKVNKQRVNQDFYPSQSLTSVLGFKKYRRCRKKPLSIPFKAHTSIFWVQSLHLTSCKKAQIFFRSRTNIYNSECQDASGAG